jgi:hypothetical protein
MESTTGTVLRMIVMLMISAGATLARGSRGRARAAWRRQAGTGEVFVPDQPVPGRLSFTGQNQASRYFPFELLCSLYWKIVPFCYAGRVSARVNITASTCWPPVRRKIA